MSKTIRVLIVDDEVRFVETLAKRLRERRFHVSPAFDGFEGVNAIKHGDGFDVVVLDIKMPGMDGIETLNEMKKLAPDTEVIMLTGHATVSSGIQAMRLGAYDYLMKPCDIEDVVEKIKEAHERRSIKRHPVLWPRKTVGEIVLHHVAKLGPEAPLIKALEVMSRESGQEAVEVVYILDHEDRLKGMVTKRDLLNEAQKARPDVPLTWTNLLKNSQLLSDKRSVEIMRPAPITTNPDEGLADVARQMIMNNIRCMPVVKAGKVIGIIKMQDIFKYVDDEME